jgi:hypothetical protein
MKIDNSSFERVEVFEYLGTTLTYQNSIQEEIKNRLKSGTSCRIFRLAVCYPKYKIMILQNHNFACCFVWV